MGAGEGEGKPLGRSFWLIFGLKGVALPITGVVCSAIGRLAPFFSLMASIADLTC